MSRHSVADTGCKKCRPRQSGVEPCGILVLHSRSVRRSKVSEIFPWEVEVPKGHSHRRSQNWGIAPAIVHFNESLHSNFCVLFGLCFAECTGRLRIPPGGWNTLFSTVTDWDIWSNILTV